MVSTQHYMLGLKKAEKLGKSGWGIYTGAMVRLNSLPKETQERIKAQYLPKKAPKYGNIRKVCKNNHNHPSTGEANYCETLHLWMKAKDCPFTSIGYEIKFPLVVNGKVICVHKPDFVLYDDAGAIWEIHEFKGMPTPTWRIKKKMFNALFPELEYVVIGLKVKKKAVKKVISKRGRVPPEGGVPGSSGAPSHNF